MLTVSDANAIRGARWRANVGRRQATPGNRKRRSSQVTEQRRAYLLRQLEKLSPGCTITITPAEAA